jgi:hypothetical protein
MGRWARLGLQGCYGCRIWHGQLSFFRFRMMDTPNFIDFFHLEAGRDRHGKIAACEGICWLLGRINPKKKSYSYISCVFRVFNLDAQIKAFFELVGDCVCEACKFQCLVVMQLYFMSDKEYRTVNGLFVDGMDTI